MSCNNYKEISTKLVHLVQNRLIKEMNKKRFRDPREGEIAKLFRPGLKRFFLLFKRIESSENHRLYNWEFNYSRITFRPFGHIR